jgi:hypothetical protein
VLWVEVEAYAAQPHSLNELHVLDDCSIVVEISIEEKQQIFISFADSL